MIMFFFRLVLGLLLLFSVGCKKPNPEGQSNIENSSEALFKEKKLAVRGALVSTRFSSFEELKKTIKIEYFNNCGVEMEQCNYWVKLAHQSNGKKVQSILAEGVSELDFIAARDSGFISKIKLLFLSPYSVYKRKELKAVAILARKNWHIYGEGAPAFYDMSKHIMGNIDPEDLELLDSLDLNSEKGYFNTVNHILALSLIHI